MRRPRRSTLFPYTTLFRSDVRAWAQRRRRESASAADLVDTFLVLEAAAPMVPEESARLLEELARAFPEDRKSTRLNSSHANNSYRVFCLKKKNNSRPRRACHSGTLFFCTYAASTQIYTLSLHDALPI